MLSAIAIWQKKQEALTMDSYAFDKAAFALSFTVDGKGRCFP
jgi:hypothetical protein